MKRMTKYSGGSATKPNNPANEEKTTPNATARISSVLKTRNLFGEL